MNQSLVLLLSAKRLSVEVKSFKIKGAKLKFLPVHYSKKGDELIMKSTFSF
jgi:hypothetical protein